MQRLLLIEAAVCAALIMVAALVMVRRWRRRTGRDLLPSRARSEAAAEVASGDLPPRPAAVVPGFSADAMSSGASTRAGQGRSAGPGARVRAEPEQAAGPRAGDAADRKPDRPAGRRASDVPGPGPRLNGPACKPGGPRAAAHAPTSTDRISSYYEQADRAMADYLAALGWAGDAEAGVPGIQGPGSQDPGSQDPGT